MRMYVCLPAVATAAMLSGVAQAATWPASVQGSWTLIADQHELVLTVASQASTIGCPQISGTILDDATQITDNMVGVYCPKSGRISFLRTTTSGQTFQNYSGNVSQVVRGHLHYIGGTFSENATPANVGEYGFYASR